MFLVDLDSDLEVVADFFREFLEVGRLLGLLALLVYLGGGPETKKLNRLAREIQNEMKTLKDTE